MAPLKLTLLGGFEVRSASGAPVALRQKKAQLLLAYLALHPGEAQPRERLANLLWSDRGDEQARSSLRQALTALRKALSDSPLVADRESIVLRPEAVEVDAVTFETLVASGTRANLERAADLYRGELLEGESIRSPAFEEWLFYERQRLKELALAAFARLMAHQQEAREDTAAVETARRLLRLDATQELAHRSLMRLYVRQGRRAEALKQYKECRAALKRELDAEPGQETNQLYEGILHGKATATPPKSEALHESQATVEPPTGTPDVPTAGPVDLESGPVGQVAEKTAEEPAETSREPERRQITVMSCHMSGSAGFSQRLDPEDLREVIQAFQETCAEQVERYEGFTAKFMGGDALVYFGYPQAHEDDAQRAVHAGLGIVDAMEDLNGRLSREKGVTVAARVGIATGLVVAGDLIGEKASEEKAVVGEAPNLAARLKELAEPNSVVIGLRTHRLAGRFFEYAELGAHDLKGLSEPVRAWRVVAATVAESRFEATHAGGLTPLVGREQEIALLLDRWKQVKEGEGQVMLLSGEPGIGKSRIAQTLGERIAGEPHTRLRYQCSPYYINSALYPTITQLERAARFERDDEPETKLDKLEALLALSGRAVPEVAPLFARLLSIPGGDRYRPLNLSPEQQKAKTLEAMTDQVVGLAAQEPVLLVMEDVHWIDPTSLESLGLVIDQVQTARVLVIITFRPEFTPPWTGHTQVTSLTLNRLSRKQGAAMVEKVTAGKALPAEVRKQIIAKTDGVPLFVEELTKTVLESGLMKEESDRYVLTGPLPPLAIPASLQDTLTARLDRLTSVREVAQIGATIGRDFSGELLAAVSPMRDNELQDALGQLVQSELIFRRGVPPHESYSFKHALVRDAAFESQLKGKRQQLHSRIANVLEGQFPERTEAEPELLAYHLTEAGLAEPAMAYWKKAGLRAIERSANVEAVAHLTKGLEQLAALPDSGERPQQELALQAPLATALTAAKGYAAPETVKVLMRSRELCQEVGDTSRMFEVLYGIWAYNYVAGNPHAALERAEECFELVRREGKRTRLTAAHSMLGQTLAALGRFDTAEDHLEKSIASYEPEEDRSLGFVYGEDPGLVSLSYLIWVLWLKGFPEQAIARSHEAVNKAEELSHAVSRCAFLCGYAIGRCLRREPKETQEIAQAVIDFSTEQNLPQFSTMATVLSGWALAERGHPEEGIARMHRGLAEFRATGSEFFTPLWLALLAQGYHRCGKFEEGLEMLNDAFDALRRGGEDAWKSELERLRGACLLSISSKNVPEAETAFRRAIEVAKRQNARSLELRAAMSLARLWQNQGKTAEASDLLAPIYDWFTEGFETADLKEAKALLEELS